MAASIVFRGANYAKSGWRIDLYFGHPSIVAKTMSASKPATPHSGTQPRRLPDKGHARECDLRTVAFSSTLR